MPLLLNAMPVSSICEVAYDHGFVFYYLKITTNPLTQSFIDSPWIVSDFNIPDSVVLVQDLMSGILEHGQWRRRIRSSWLFKKKETCAKHSCVSLNVWDTVDTVSERDYIIDYLDNGLFVAHPQQGLRQLCRVTADVHPCQVSPLPARCQSSTWSVIVFLFYEHGI